MEHLLVKHNLKTTFWGLKIIPKLYKDKKKSVEQDGRHMECQTIRCFLTTPAYYVKNNFGL
jgi:hypothetical protein